MPNNNIDSSKTTKITLKHSKFRHQYLNSTSNSGKYMLKASMNFGWIKKSGIKPEKKSES